MPYYMPEVEAARAVVFELIGRNVMRFQRLELMLKHSLNYTDLQITDLDLNKGLKRNDPRGNRNTLGTLAGQTYKSLIVPFSQEDVELPETPLPEGARIRFDVSFKYKTSPEIHKEAQARLKRLVENRNELIHSSFQSFHLETAAGCAEALAHLEQQAIELRSETDYFKSVNDAIQQGLLQLQSKEFLEAARKSFRESNEQSNGKGDG